MGRRAVMAASCVTIVYRLVVETSKGQSGSQMLMYFRICRRKSSLSLLLPSELTNFFSPESPSSAVSALCESLPRTTSRKRIAVTSSSLNPRVRLYLLRFFRIVVQKYTLTEDQHTHNVHYTGANLAYMIDKSIGQDVVVARKLGDSQSLFFWRCLRGVAFWWPTHHP